MNVFSCNKLNSVSIYDERSMKTKVSNHFLESIYGVGAVHLQILKVMSILYSVTAYNFYLSGMLPDTVILTNIFCGELCQNIYVIFLENVLGFQVLHFILK